jgi:DNA-binding transcriptional LysR family regulator
MNTQFLESFLLVVEYGSVAEAARRLSLTPAGVTQRLKALEQELGMALVSRSGRTLRPTEAGWSILPQAQALLSGVRDLRTMANEKSFAGKLNLGAVPSALTGLLPPILSSLVEKYPLMSLSVHPGASKDLYNKVISGELHAAVLIEPQFALPKTCDWVTWREEPLVVLTHGDVTERDPHRILQSEPFIRYDRERRGGQMADDYLQQFQLTVRDRHEVSSLEAIAIMVSRKMGVSLVPDWAPPWPEGLSLKKFALPQSRAKRHVGILWRRATPRIRLVRALLAEAETRGIGAAAWTTGSRSLAEAGFVAI